MAVALLRLVLLAVACAAPALGLVANAVPHRPISSASRAAVTMGPAKDGPFTPIVLAAKVVLGEPTLLKLRGKGIAYHSQYINEFCSECAALPMNPAPRSHSCNRLWELVIPAARLTHLAVGVPKKVNQGLIKKAKAVGSDLGFLS